MLRTASYICTNTNVRIYYYSIIIIILYTGLCAGSVVMNGCCFHQPWDFASALIVARSRCLRSCKEASMSFEMRTPDPETLDDIRNRRHYAYLHFCYYKVCMRMFVHARARVCICVCVCVCMYVCVLMCFLVMRTYIHTCVNVWIQYTSCGTSPGNGEW